MDTVVGTTRTTASVTPTGAPAALRRLYLVRAAFALVWAALMFATADSLGPVSTTLLVVYPLFDVACAVVDARSANTVGAPLRGLYLNMAISAVATVALAVGATSGIPAVLRVWGIWAITAGLVQLVVGAGRRGLGGQWAMIASGGISVLAGASFILQAGKDDPSLNNVAGYALLGGIFFLVSALRLKSGTSKGV